MNEIKEKLKQFEPNDEFHCAQEENVRKMEKEKLEAIEGFIAHRRKRKKNFYTNQKKVDTIENEIEASEDLRKNKMLIEFNDAQCSSPKQIAVKTQTSVKCTTRFLAGKMLMFAKLSLKSFIYSLAELLTFPEGIVREIYDEYLIERILVFHILTNTASASIQFVAVSSVDSTFTKPEFRNILFRIFSNTDIRERFDKSDDFWNCFGMYDFSNQKVLVLYEVENINDPCYVTLAVNPKEYFEYFKSNNVNKKHNGIKKGSPGMEYENYGERIKPLYDLHLLKNQKWTISLLLEFLLKKAS